MNEKIAELIEQVVAEEGFEFVHCEMTGGPKQKVLRVLADHPSGMTHEHCSFLSRRIGQHLDRVDPIHQPYTLEVSSPGVERGLYRLADYRRFVGRNVHLRTSAPVAGRRTVRGRLIELREADGDAEPTVTVALKDGRELAVPFSSVEKAHLEVDLKELFQTAENKAGLVKGKNVVD